MRKIAFFSLIFAFSSFCFAETSPDVKPNPWSLIIYRPLNNGEMNDVRCYVKFEDENGNDVTYSKIKAKYEWINQNSNPSFNNSTSLYSLFDKRNYRNLIEYRKTYFLQGGMAMYLNLQPGKYKISVYTPQDKTNLFETENEGDWLSNVFEYNTENPTNVIFVSATANDNGFYNGGWFIDYKAPVFTKFTNPKM